MLLRIAATLALSLSARSALGAYLLEIDTDGADDGVITYNPGFNFGGDTTIASQSATSAAYGTTGGDSLFGGDGTQLPDTYVYAYSPVSQPDNLAIPAGTDLGEGDLASGATGGGTGAYRVYATWPYTDNVTGGLTRYEVIAPGDSFTIDINQNDASDLMGTAGRGDVWVYLGEINYTGGVITVSQKATVQNSFVSMRAYGVLFEAAVPTPGAVMVLGLGGLGAMRRRR